MAATLRFARFARSALAANPPAAIARNARFSRDTVDGGPYRVRGAVTELGVAGPYRVRLFERRDARCIRETWSAADGSYSFVDIAYRYQGYFVVAYDHGDSPHNAAIADLVTPEPMP